MRTPRILLTSALAIAAFLVPSAAWATGEPAPTMQNRVDAVIAEFGGEQSGWNAVSWESGAVVLSLDPEGAQEELSTSARTAISVLAADNCASARYCAYSGTSYTGNKLTYATCPATYTSFGALLGPVRSVKNDLSGKTVRVYAGTAIRATLAGGAGTTNVTGITKIQCS